MPVWVIQKHNLYFPERGSSAIFNIDRIDLWRSIFRIAYKFNALDEQNHTRAHLRPIYNYKNSSSIVCTFFLLVSCFKVSFTQLMYIWTFCFQHLIHNNLNTTKMKQAEEEKTVKVCSLTSELLFGLSSKTGRTIVRTEQQSKYWQHCWVDCLWV